MSNTGVSADGIVWYKGDASSIDFYFTRANDRVSAQLDGALLIGATSAVLKSPGADSFYAGQTATFSSGLPEEESALILSRDTVTDTITFSALSNAHSDSASVTAIVASADEGAQVPLPTVTSGVYTVRCPVEGDLLFSRSLVAVDAAQGWWRLSLIVADTAGSDAKQYVGAGRIMIDGGDSKTAPSPQVFDLRATPANPSL